MTAQIPELFSIQGKTALVTGASSGLGRQFAKCLGSAGANLVLAARRSKLLDEFRIELADMGIQAEAIALDVTSAESVRELGTECRKRFSSIDILVNNAGTSASAPFLDTQDAQWDVVLETNLRGCFLVARECAELMRSSGAGGSIINIASIAGIRQASQISAYSASKAALIQLTKTMALELARYRIRVNAIAPGYISTDLNRDFLLSEAGRALLKRIPQRRLGMPEDLDGPLLLLASDASRYMSGTTIVVDGGHLVSSL